MLPVKFKKTPCRPIEFKGQGPLHSKHTRFVRTRSGGHNCNLSQLFANVRNNSG